MVGNIYLHNTVSFNIVIGTIIIQNCTNEIIYFRITVTQLMVYILSSLGIPNFAEYAVCGY